MTREELQNDIDNSETDIATKLTSILNQVNSEKEEAVKLAVNEERLKREQAEHSSQVLSNFLEKILRENNIPIFWKRTIQFF